MGYGTFCIEKFVCLVSPNPLSPFNETFKIDQYHVLLWLSYPRSGLMILSRVIVKLEGQALYWGRHLLYVKNNILVRYKNCVCYATTLANIYFIFIIEICNTQWESIIFRQYNKYNGISHD